MFLVLLRKVTGLWLNMGDFYLMLRRWEKWRLANFPVILDFDLP